jgi:glutamate-ammonia-ligase adenylyltransferase
MRWINVDSPRPAKLYALAKIALDPADFSPLLQSETDSGMPLSRAMRRLRNLVIASLIARDLGGQADLNEVVTSMSAFADFAIRSHVAALMDEMIVAHGMPIGEESGRPQELIVIGMGKLGGHELNVSSDIDLIFVYPEDGETQLTSDEQRQLSNQEFFTRLGKKLIGALSEIAEDGFTFRVDMALRPNGNSGPLVASLAMLEEYFIVQGREWERYAWVKARAITGHEQDITALDKLIHPFVYRRYLDYGAIDAIRNMHAQIRAEVVRQEARHPDRNNNVKLGRGGIREIEFLAQVFQLIRGGRDASLRDRSTRRTLRLLAEKSLLQAEVVDSMLESYVFLRNLEHRLQYLDDAQTHTFPSNQEDQLAVARMMGYSEVQPLLDALAEHRNRVAAQFDAIFSDKRGEQAGADEQADPRLQAVLSASDGEEAIQAHLTNLRYDDP